MIRFPRRAWQPAVALWLAAAVGALLVPDPKPAKAVATKLEDVRALLAARSPGAREDGALYQTKLSLLDKYDPGHHERVLGGDRYHDGGGAGAGGYPVGGVPGGGGPDGLPVPGGDGGGAGGDDGPGGPVASFAGGIGGALPAVGGLSPGGGNGGGGNAGGGTVTPPVPAIALPEPATWLCMIVGLFAVGSAVRRRSLPALQAFR